MEGECKHQEEDEVLLKGETQPSDVLSKPVVLVEEEGREARR